MALTQRLDLRQTQALVMTPQLQQAIKLLQLNNLELSAYVEAEVERNPLLEHDDADVSQDGREAERDAQPEQPSTDSIGSDRLAAADTLVGGDDGPLDADYSNVWADDSGGTEPAFADGSQSSARSSAARDFETRENGWEQTLPRVESLRDHLLPQVNITLSQPADRLIGSHLVDMLDEAGYLPFCVEEVAAQFGTDVTRIERILDRLRTLDPPGVFARSLAECLAIQLADRDRLDPAMQALLDNLDLLAKRDYAALSRLCGVDREDIADMIGEIRALDPKPGLAFSSEIVQTLIPDVLMRPQPGGGWRLELNPDTLPSVLVNRRYHTLVNATVRNKEEKEFVAECLQTANWLVKALHQRANTILKVAGEIVRQQDAFFVHGIGRLKPLILRDIADVIGMHESTVSRVTSGKFIATPRGIFELKFFFTAAIQGADGAESHSAESVRFRIKALIDAESAKEVLSDDRLVEVLRNEGIDIARRTVAKYREAMKIPSSVQRRREKAMQL